ncbi:hypothetical protein GR7B_00080 [Vibrio phage vB_VcorM_GR7B]|nr:hypothetical protein GR7B_00080 [Vibrio phage vB_VcorM_GR7B]
MTKKRVRPTKVRRFYPGGPRRNKSGVVRIKRATYGGAGTTKSKEWRDLREIILKRDGYCCTKCGRHKSELKAGECLQVDHIKPVSRGGTDKKSNLRTLCYPKCHGSLYLHGHIRKKHKTKRNKERLA